MSNELAIVNNLIALTEMPKDQVRRAMDRSFLAGLVSKYPTLNQADIIEFINKCQLTGADPRLNQVYLQVNNTWNKDKKVSEPKGVTIFSYHFFIQAAQRTGELEDFGVDIVPETYVDLLSGRERKSITAIAFVKRKGYGKITYKARFWEFAKLNKENQLCGKWLESPYLMLEKCAIANAMRWAFPEALSGIYTSEEMTKDGDDPVPMVVETPKHNMLPGIEEKKTMHPVEAVKKLKEIKEELKKEDPVVVEEKQAEEEKKPDKIDFSGRDIEDLRQELVQFLNVAPDDLFEKLKKTRDFLIQRVLMEQNLDGMKQKYSIIMKFI